MIQLIWGLATEVYIFLPLWNQRCRHGWFPAFSALSSCFAIMLSSPLTAFLIPGVFSFLVSFVTFTLLFHEFAWKIPLVDHFNMELLDHFNTKTSINPWSILSIIFCSHSPLLLPLLLSDTMFIFSLFFIIIILLF